MSNLLWLEKIKWRKCILFSVTALAMISLLTGCSSSNSDEKAAKEFKCAMKSSVDYTCSYSVWAEKCECKKK